MATQYEKRKAKEKEDNVEVTENYDRVAYDAVFDDQKKKYIMIHVEYDSATGAARVKEREVIGDSKPMAAYHLQKNLVRKVLGIDK